MKLAVLLVALIACLSGGLNEARAGEELTLRVKGVLRSYYLHVPTDLRPGAPLVFFLHGAGSTGRDDTVRFGWRRKAETEGFIVVGPDAWPILANGKPINTDGNPRVWNDDAPYLTQNVRDSDDTGFILALIDEMARLHRIDRRRVYVAGFSSGGSMAYRLAQEIPNRIAAAVSAAGQFTELKPRPSRGVPVMYYSGDADLLNPVAGGELPAPWGAMLKKEPHIDIVGHWQRLNECPAAPVEIRDPTLLEYVEVTGPCRDGSEVRYVLVHGLHHDWPVDERALGRTLSATNQAWNFFMRFQLPAEPAGN